MIALPYKQEAIRKYNKRIGAIYHNRKKRRKKRRRKKEEKREGRKGRREIEINLTRNMEKLCKNFQKLLKLIRETFIMKNSQNINGELFLVLE